MKNINWVPVKEYWKFDLLIKPLIKIQAFRKSHLESFISDLIDSISSDLHLSEDELKDLFHEKNKAFYELMEEIYLDYEDISIYSTSFKKLFSILLIPEVPKSTILTNLYDSLSLREKKNFLDMLNKKMQ